jgi:hypothetical protein
MAFRVQDFRAQMVTDGARPNLFQCTLNFPTLAVNSTPGTGFASGNGASTKFTFMCKTAQLPGSSVNQVPVFYFGRELKFAGNRTFPEWTVTVINDEDFVIRKAFEKWLSGINSHAGNLRNAAFVQGDGGYQQDATVFQYGKTGRVLKKYNFVGLFPVDISPIELDWGANDTIEEYAVTFAYQWWESDTTDALTNVRPVAG